MTQNAANWIWIDLEMTGLDTDKDAIIEIATVVTDQHLEVLAEGPVLAIHQPESVLSAMDEWNQKTHSASGLLDRVRSSDLDAAAAEQRTLGFLKEWVPSGVSPMCGNSICQDRRFLHRCMPELERYFHYRNLDVSTLKELANRWVPGLPQTLQKNGRHIALLDILDSIEELRFYRAHFLRVENPPLQ